MIHQANLEVLAAVSAGRAEVEGAQHFSAATAKRAAQAELSEAEEVGAVSERVGTWETKADRELAEAASQSSSAESQAKIAASGIDALEVKIRSRLHAGAVSALEMLSVATAALAPISARVAQAEDAARAAERVTPSL